MAYNRSEVKVLWAELQKVLDEFAKSHGIDIVVGNASYSDVEVSFKVAVSQTGVDKDAAMWREYAPLFGLSASDYGKKIRIAGEEHVVCGIKPNARKNIVVVMDEKGKRYVIPRQMFIRCGGTDTWEWLGDVV